MTNEDKDHYGGVWCFHSRCAGDPASAAVYKLKPDICTKCHVKTHGGPCRRYMGKPLMHLCVACAEPYLALEALRQ